ncbi:MAG: energy-coupling factor transporter transmembrane protein EcfT [Ruminococcaceae bacterium]|nr:energy-coupling factor transporter transmembrane protein EcfT [Oscillospiraceae bacterium]
MTHLNPFVLLCYFAAAAGISMFSMNPVIQTVSLAGALSFFFVRNAGKKTGMHLPIFLTALTVAVLNPLFQHNGATVLFVLNGNPVTKEACIYGAVAALMLLATLYWFRSFSELMTSDKILYLFGRISPKLALLLSMAMRYIPLFGLQLKKTTQAQKAMGYFKEDNMLDRIRGSIRVFSVTVTWALETGILTADSMEARGYGMGKRSAFAVFRFYRKDGLYLALIGILFSIAVYGIATEAVAFQYYPFILRHEQTLISILAYGAYGILAFLPTAAEAGEKIKWKYLQSKI